MIELSGYRILEPIHRGNKSLVYRADRIIDGQRVVIKVLRNEVPTFNELVHFRNQFAIARPLNLPEIIRPYHLLPYGHGYALVMEEFGGISLKAWMEHRRPRGSGGVTVAEGLAIALQLSDALQGLYQHRIIHKDIKPSNILINTDTQQIKLTDFSIASRLPRETTTAKTTQQLEGTLAYISPEQTGRMNRGLDYRTDYYSLGVTLYELLTGQLPFAATTPMEMVYCQIAQSPPQLH